MPRLIGILSLIFICRSGSAIAQNSGDPVTDANRRTHNVVLVTIDGLRWQEVFGGADLQLIDKTAGSVPDVDETTRRYHRETPEERRELLMPFLWSVIARQGVLIGNPDFNCRARVTNGRNFSYPGYSEILCGFPDSRIDSNAKKNNDNVTVLEWIEQQPGYENSVAAFCSWDVFPFIINESRSGIPVNAGWEPLASDESIRPGSDEALREFSNLDTMANELPKYFPQVRYDNITVRGALQYLKSRKPRLLYVAMGETDDWAHAGRYDLYLDATVRTDAFLRQLWETVQSMPEYRDRTTLVITTDHGRGDTRVEWKSHGENIPGSDQIWMAVLGPDTIPQDIRDVEFTQSQIAATVATALGFQYGKDVPQAGRSLPVFSAQIR